METSQVKEATTNAVIFAGPCKVTFALSLFDQKDQNNVDIKLYDNATEATGTIIYRALYQAGGHMEDFQPFYNQVDCKNGVYAVVPGLVSRVQVGIGLE